MNIQYLPQYKNQLIESIAPAIIGSYVGGKTGYNVGRSIGSAIHSFKTMGGAAYKAMRELGLTHEAAQKLSTDEAFLSSLIEFSDSLLEGTVSGYGKVAGKLGLPQLLGNGAKAASKTGGVAGKLLGLGKLGVNGLSEGFEEGTQETVSIANQNRALSGYTGDDENFFQRVWGLTKDAVPIWWDSMKGLLPGFDETENTQQIWDATKGGMQVGLVMGGLGMATSGAVNTVLDNTVNADPRYTAVREGTAQQAQSLDNITGSTIDPAEISERQASANAEQTSTNAEQNGRNITQEAPVQELTQAQQQEMWQELGLTEEQQQAVRERWPYGTYTQEELVDFLDSREALDRLMQSLNDEETAQETQTEAAVTTNPVRTAIDQQTAPVQKIQQAQEVAAQMQQNPETAAQMQQEVDPGTAALQRLAAEMDQRQQAEDAIRAQQETEAFEAAQTAIYQQQNRQRWTRSRETVEQRGSGLAESAATDKWSRQDAAAVDKMARQLGVKVYTENARNIGGGAGEGSITGNVVLLDENMDATEAIRRVAGHEPFVSCQAGKPGRLQQNPAGYP